jgi:hypothetical protein
VTRTRFKITVTATVVEYIITVGCLFTGHDLSGLAAVFTAINVGLLAYIIGDSWRASHDNKADK